MDRARVHAEHSPSRCPFCRDELDATKEELAACAPCGARHHAACHRTHGRCATCGATDVLVAPGGLRRRDQPPTGSRLRVSSPAPGATTYTWAVGSDMDWVAAAILVATCVLSPLALWIVWLRATIKALEIRLGPDAIEVPTGTSSPWTLRVPRGEVGAIRVSNADHGATVLTVDVGIHRHTVWTGVTSSLTAPELEWLAEQLTAWRDQA